MIICQAINIKITADPYFSRTTNDHFSINPKCASYFHVLADKLELNAMPITIKKVTRGSINIALSLIGYTEFSTLMGLCSLPLKRVTLLEKAR